jgi:hypothetical protein
MYGDHVCAMKCCDQALRVNLGIANWRFRVHQKHVSVFVTAFFVNATAEIGRLLVARAFRSITRSLCIT